MVTDHAFSMPCIALVSSLFGYILCSIGLAHFITGKAETVDDFLVV